MHRRGSSNPCQPAITLLPRKFSRCRCRRIGIVQSRLFGQHLSLGNTHGGFQHFSLWLESPFLLAMSNTPLSGGTTVCLPIPLARDIGSASKSERSCCHPRRPGGCVHISFQLLWVGAKSTVPDSHGVRVCLRVRHCHSVLRGAAPSDPRPWG